MAVKSWERAAEEFGRREYPNKWDLALLVARFAYRAEPGRKAKAEEKSRQGGAISVNADGKASLADFAKHAQRFGHKSSESTVGRYLDVWDEAAKGSVVAATAVLRPADEYGLPEDLRLWTEESSKTWDTYAQAAKDAKGAARTERTDTARKKALEEVQQRREDGKEVPGALLAKAGLVESEPAKPGEIKSYEKLVSDADKVAVRLSEAPVPEALPKDEAKAEVKVLRHAIKALEESLRSLKRVVPDLFSGDAEAGEAA